MLIGDMVHKLWILNVKLPFLLSLHQGSWHLHQQCNGQPRCGRASGSKLNGPKPGQKALFA